MTSVRFSCLLIRHPHVLSACKASGLASITSLQMMKDVFKMLLTLLAEYFGGIWKEQLPCWTAQYILCSLYNLKARKEIWGRIKRIFQEEVLYCDRLPMNHFRN